MCARAQVELLDLTCSLEKLRDCFALMIEVVRGTRQKRIFCDAYTRISRGFGH